MAAFVAQPVALAVLLHTARFLATAARDAGVLVSKGHSRPDEDLVDGLRPHFAEFFCILAALAVAVLAERSYNPTLCTLGEALAVQLQALRLLAVAFGDGCVLSVFKEDPHLLGAAISVVGGAIDCREDVLEKLRGGVGRAPGQQFL